MPVMRSEQFKHIVEPLLNSQFNGIYDQRVGEYKQVFSVDDGEKRAYQEDVVLYGFGAAPLLPDGQAITYDEGGELYVKRYEYDVYGLAFSITRTLVEDGAHLRVGSTYSRHLAQSMAETEETVPVQHLNRAFTSGYNGGDGVTLVSASHPVIGGVQSNLLTAAAFSQTSLEQALITCRNMKDARGKNIRIMPKQLILHPSNMLNAEVVLKSVLRTGTNVNDLNAVKSSGLIDKFVVLSRLTSQTAWFLQTDADNGLKFLWRRRTEGGMEGDFATDSTRYKKTMRFGSGWTEHRAILGNAGV